MHAKVLLLASLALHQIAGATSDDSPPESPIAETASGYLEAIQAQDWEGMHALLTQDSLYQDFTMEYFDREPVELEGADAIVDFWRTSSEDSGTSSIQYEVRKSFVAGPVFVADVWATITVSGEYWDVDEEEVELSATLIVFLRVVDGKVLHHVDHVDYAAALEPIETERPPPTSPSKKP
jgi:hypothetical protein